MKKRFTEEQIIGFLREAEAGLAVAELWSCPKSPDTLTLSNRVIGFNDIGV